MSESGQFFFNQFNVVLSGFLASARNKNQFRELFLIDRL
jgi:hypothetical protein